ncbi:MAG: hypothetical protein V3R13_03415, partial [Nitrososphaerales archaeon]
EILSVDADAGCTPMNGMIWEGKDLPILNVSIELVASIETAITLFPLARRNSTTSSTYDERTEGKRCI